MPGSSQTSMQVEVHSQEDFGKMDDGVSFQGTITATYRRIAKVLGVPFVSKEPSECPVEWYLSFDQKTPAVIYLKFDSPSRICLKSLRRSEVWHVGARSEDVVERLAQVLKCKTFSRLSDYLRMIPQTEDDAEVPF